MSPSSAGAAGQANAANTSGTPAGNPGSKPVANEGAAATAESEEELRIKRQLAEQEAQIKKLRSDQLSGGDQLPGAMPDEPVALGDPREMAKLSDRQAAPDSSNSSSKSQDELAVFPRDGNAANEPVSQPVAAPVAERSVYFGYDQFSVPEKYDAMLISHATWLMAHPDLEADVQGNCDERGSREYNLALGARRAESVKRALVLAGVDGKRINVVSYGAEKPLAQGKDEESYSQNRRVDILY